MKSLILLSLTCLVQALPNIVLFVGDDIGWADHSVNYETDISTEIMKEYADEGIRLENHYTSPVCSPTRTSLMTGIYPFRVGMQHQETLCPGTKAHVPRQVPMLPELLKPLGYRSKMIGKWHLGYACEEYTPLGRGFESHYGYYQGQVDYNTKMVASGYDFWRDGIVDPSGRHNHSTILYAEEIRGSVAELTRSPSQPFFLYLPMQTVHVPLQPLRETVNCRSIEDVWRRDYCNMIQDIDFLFGVLISALKDAAIYEDSFVLFTTDNGGMVDFSRDPDGSPSWPSSLGRNYPLRGSKTTLFEGGVRVTTFVTGGFLRREHRGTSFSGLSHAVDIAATIVGMAGGDVVPMDGVSLLDQFEVGRGARLEVPINIIFGGRSYSALRKGRYKLITGSAVMWDETDGWWGYEHAPPPVFNQTSYLFDLVTDPYEREALDIESNYPLYLDMLRALFAYTRNWYSEPQFNFPSKHSFPWHHKGVWAPFLHGKPDC